MPPGVDNLHQSYFNLSASLWSWCQRVLLVVQISRRHFWNGMRLSPCLHGNINKEVNRTDDSISGLRVHYYLIIKIPEWWKLLKTQFSEGFFGLGNMKSEETN